MISMVQVQSILRKYVDEDYQQDLESLNLSLNEAIDVAQNCPLWRMMSTFGAMHSQCYMAEVNEWMNEQVHSTSASGTHYKVSVTCVVIVRRNVKSKYASINNNDNDNDNNNNNDNKRQRQQQQQQQQQQQ